MRIFMSRAFAGIAVLAAVAITGCGGEESNDTPAPMAESAEHQDSAKHCLAPASWFPHAQTPEPNDSADFEINCDFHQWSWQMFLWLTQETGSGLRFESFRQPNPAGSDEFASVSSTLMLMPRVTKSADPTTFNEINQAGSLGMMIDQNNRAVYYAMYVNDIFVDFVKEHKLETTQGMLDCPDTLDFPIGAMELKAAWKIVSPGDNTEGMYTRTAEVATLVQQGNKVVVDQNKTESVTVALVGLHIAGVVKDHPEFIWATFEHNRNAPTLTDEQLKRYMDTKDSKINNEPVSEHNFTFYKAGTTFIQSNQNNAGIVKITDQTKQTLTPITNAFLQYAQGGGNEENRKNIDELNASVKKQLKDPIFSNYYLGGAIWLNGGNKLVPNSDQQDVITGSTELSNVTMETFTQKVLDQRNCFSCHNTLQRFPESLAQLGVQPLPGKNVNVSHILVNHYFQQAQLEKGATGGN